MLLTLYVVLVVALPVALGLLVAFNGLPRSRLCPLCASETLRIRSTRHGILSRPFRNIELHSRWCTSCEWSGTVRVARPLPARVRTPSVRPAMARRTGGLEIRRIEMDGASWRVQLECWAEQDGWQGRLLFVGPGGRAWADGWPLLTGRSAAEVLSKVMSLSDRALAGRIRQATR